MAHRLLAPLLFLAAALPLSGATFNVAVGGADLMFAPPVVHIQTGDTVVWTNAGGYHSVQADDGSFGNSAAYPPWTLNHTFNTAGTFGYHCAIHGVYGMVGSVVVADAGGGGGGVPGTLGFSLAGYTVNEGA